MGREVDGHEPVREGIGGRDGGGRLEIVGCVAAAGELDGSENINDGGHGGLVRGIFRTICVVCWFDLVYDREDIRRQARADWRFGNKWNGAKSSEMERHSLSLTSFLHPDSRLRRGGQERKGNNVDLPKITGRSTT